MASRDGQSEARQTTTSSSTRIRLFIRSTAGRQLLAGDLDLQRPLDGVTVVDNLVFTNAWHGISLYGVDNALVINNTVVPSRADRFPAWLMIHDAKDKTPSRNVVVRNNMCK